MLDVCTTGKVGAVTYPAIIVASAVIALAVIYKHRMGKLVNKGLEIPNDNEKMKV